MSTRSCTNCANTVSWDEYGQFCWDCTAPAADSTWRENLDAWGIDPGPYCGDYVWFDPANDITPEDF